MQVDTVKVLTFAMRTEAEFAQQLLRNENIESQVKGDDAGGWAPYISFATGGYSIWVLKENEQRAQQILADRFDAGTPDPGPSG